MEDFFDDFDDYDKFDDFDDGDFMDEDPFEDSVDDGDDPLSNEIATARGSTPTGISVRTESVTVSMIDSEFESGLTANTKAPSDVMAITELERISAPLSDTASASAWANGTMAR